LSVSHPGNFSSNERAPGMLWLGIWVTPNAGFDLFRGEKYLASAKSWTTIPQSSKS